jgi:uncharacterized protein YceH (UPF0502 family)
LNVELTPIEARVIGSLMEKSVVTPDIYPLTLNALVSACNQKSSRDPVMNLEAGKVLQAVRALEGKRLIRIERNPRTEVEKYAQRLCNTPFSDLQFDPAEFSIVCVLLLRGPRTPGELRTNSGRLHEFAENDEVAASLTRLAGGERAPVVAELPRVPGRRDNEWAHLLGGPIDLAALARAHPPEQPPEREGRSTTTTPVSADLEGRIAALESELTELRRLVEAHLLAPRPPGGEV